MSKLNIYTFRLKTTKGNVAYYKINVKRKFMHIGNKIKLIREKNHLNQSEFGSKLGVSQKIISNIESEKNEPSLQLIQTLIKLFQISPSWLILDGNDINIENDLEYLFFKAKKLALKNNQEDEIFNFFKNFIFTNETLFEVINKLRTIKGRDFISKLGEVWSGQGERILIVLYYFLTHLSDKKILISPKIKSDFLDFLESFNPPKRLFIISNKDKDALKNWVEQNLDEVEIIDIISSSSNMSQIINNIKNELNIFNKYTV